MIDGIRCVDALSRKKESRRWKPDYKLSGGCTLGRSAAVPTQGQREMMSRNSGSSKSGSFPGNEQVVDPALAPAASWSTSDDPKPLV
jgi:hypothetical protein